MQSEIILNKDGSIYHLQLKPENVADTVITVGDQERVALVSSFFDKVDFKQLNREFCTHTGYYQNKRITVISTGIGTDNVDVVLNELHLVANFNLQKRQPLANPRALTIVRLGTSGAIHPDIELGQVLLSSCAVGFDALLHFYNFTNAAQLYPSHPFPHLPAPYVTCAHHDLLQHFSAYFPLQGVTATLPGFYAPQGRTAALAPRTPNMVKQLANCKVNNRHVINIEMETAGIYGLSQLLGHRALSLNALLANRATGDFSAQPEKIIENMIAQALDALVALPTQPTFR